MSTKIKTLKTQELNAIIDAIKELREVKTRVSDKSIALVKYIAEVEQIVAVVAIQYQASAAQYQQNRAKIESDEAAVAKLDAEHSQIINELNAQNVQLPAFDSRLLSYCELSIASLINLSKLFI